MKHCGQDMWLWELPDYYDGALFWTCNECGAWAHRFADGHPLRERAERAVRERPIDPELEVTSHAATA